MGNIDRILLLSKEQGVSLTSLCKKIDRSRSYLSEIAARHRNVPNEYIPAIADALHTTPEYLNGETDIKEKTADLVVSGKDKELLDLIEKLTEEQRQMLILQVKGLLSDQ